jgi:SH3 domain-containing protein
MDVATDKFIALAVLFCVLFGCAGTRQGVEKPGTADGKKTAPKITVGMSRTAVLDILSRPDYEWPTEGQTILFYCTYLTEDPSKGSCTPVLFIDDNVFAVGEKDAQKWPLDTVQLVAKAVRKETPVKIGREEKTLSDITSEDIAVETLYEQKTHAPKQGDTVYVTYHTNFVRYIPLRSTPSDNGKILNTLCIGAELNVVSVQDDWLYVKGVDAYFTGWVLKRWVTDDRTVKIDAQKRRENNAPEIARLEAIVKPIPQSQWKQNLTLYKKLSALNPCNLSYQRKVDFYENYGHKRKKRKRR